MHYRTLLGSLFLSLFRSSSTSLGSRFMETDFPLNDVLPMKTGLTEEAPFELLFGLRSHAVLLPRNDGDEDCWKKKKRKNNQLINSPKQVSTISFTNETIKVNVNRRTYKVPTIYFN